MAGYEGAVEAGLRHCHTHEAADDTFLERLLGYQYAIYATHAACSKRAILSRNFI